MFIPDPDLDFFNHPGSRGKKGTGSGSATLPVAHTPAPESKKRKREM
jgi:hypothetical protein